MNSHSKQTLTLVMLVACLVAVAASPAAAQSEMTSKIRLECASNSTECPGATGAQYDFSVESGDLVLSKVGLANELRINATTGRVGLGTAVGTIEEKLTVNGASGPGTVALFINPAGPARFRFRNGSNNETWNVGHQSPSGTGLVFSDVGDAVSELLLDVNGNLTTAGTVNGSSDVNRKTDIVPVANEDILAKVASMPISEWSYKEEKGKVRHVGPMAQDFHAAFGLGSADTVISMVDADGISLASIKALYSLVQQQKSEIETLRSRLEKLETK